MHGILIKRAARRAYEASANYIEYSARCAETGKVLASGRGNYHCWYLFNQAWQDSPVIVEHTRLDVPVEYHEA